MTPSHESRSAPTPAARLEVCIKLAEAKSKGGPALSDEACKQKRPWDWMGEELRQIRDSLRTPKPPVQALDLEAIMEKLPRQFQLGVGADPYDVGCLVGEVQALRSRLSEVEALHPEALDLTVRALKHCRMFIVDGLGYRASVADEKAALRVQIDNVLALLPPVAEGTAKPSQDPKPSLTEAGGRV